MTRPPRIAREVPRGMRRPNTRLRPKHLEFIRQLPCVACGAPGPNEAAHVRTGTDGGIGMKPSDKYAVPLCESRYVIAHGRKFVIEGCHAIQHRMGELSFWSALKIDPLNLTLRLWTVSGDVAAGERAVYRARQAIELQRM